jgi:N-methylhydantoinase A/oxoprolinase/acetone carboxylase beta subunit
MAKGEKERVLFIGCGVLKLDIETLVEELNNTVNIDIDTEFLEGGLHDVPNRLRSDLQKRIDEASGSEEYDRIAVGYGICGRGTVELYARQIPLALPKVHDCIALFLGSDAAYREEFAKCPGTYYTSAGWFEEQVQPKGNKIRPAKSREEALRKMGFEYFEKKYGKQNAEAIAKFYNSWQKNYSRSAFIDTGAGDPERYGSYARDLAAEFGWEYERIPGTSRLLELLLTAEKTTEEVLFVPPEHVTEYDPKGKGLIAVPVQKREHDEDREASTILRKVRSEDETAQRKRIKRRTGLGIDAGGTYTDVAVYDFQSRKVLGKGKALTTKWDFTIGIGEAIDQLDPSYLQTVDLVSVSTTLATNAIVEGQGQKVGLLLMPSGVIDTKQIDNEPTEIISGRLAISGEVLEAVDHEEVGRVAAEMASKSRVRVFAVSGYAGSVNPEHELTVKRIVTEKTGLHVCCGHELSELLNFYVRANTAVLNARIIPLLESFIEDVEKTLQLRNVSAPMMVVKGDGSLMASEIAKSRPIETILSGPAASIAGARYLTQVGDATVVDVGGTTSDIGCIADGKVEVCPKGAKVGGWRTHVQALDMSTVGLGGDSEILFEEQKLTVGPRRIAPISWLAAHHDIEKQLDFLKRHDDYYLTTTKPLEFFVRTGSGSGYTPSPHEQTVLDALDGYPCSLLELAERIEAGHWMMVQTKSLEDSHSIQRCGLTPTDILHTLDRMDMWNRDAASTMSGIFAGRLQEPTKEFAGMIFTMISDRLITELMKKQLRLEEHSNSIDACPACRAMMQNILQGGDGKFVLKASFLQPIVGLGAPVHFFTEKIGDKVDAEIIIPADADVANAIGAITSFVTVAKQVHIVPNVEGTFSIQGVPESPAFKRIEDAQEYAVEALEREVLTMAEASGTSEDRVHLHTEDRVTKIADGSELFLERSIAARITGPPDLA